MKVPFFKHCVGHDEKTSVLAALDSEFLTTGKYVSEFEEKFSTFVGIPNTVGLTSCTAALHLGLLACGVGPGDEVITTPQTFVATSLAIIHCGATPVWVDVEPNTGNIDATKIEEKITKKTKAILPVHLYGQMCDMGSIYDIAKKYSLFIIEDAAHALLSRRGVYKVGDLSDVACFSFYATKSITCGEGGAACTRSKELSDKIRLLRSHGMSGDAATRHTGQFKHWDLLDTGWKYNMDNIKAALLLPQLSKAQYWRSARKNIFKQYQERLSEIDAIHFPEIVPAAESDYHLFTIWVDPTRRDAIIAALQAAGIGVTVNYRSINLLSAFSSMFNLGSGSFPISEKIGLSTISLPTYPALTAEEITYIVDTLTTVLQE